MRQLAVFVLGVGLLAPAAIMAQEHDRDQQKHEHKHEWNDQEKEHWHQYLNEHHKKDHEWDKASKREQKGYWKWRDAHPDNH